MRYLVDHDGFSDFQEMFKALAEDYINYVNDSYDVTLEYNRSGVKFMDNELTQYHQNIGELSDQERYCVVMNLAAYYGQCIKHACGGVWEAHPDDFRFHRIRFCEYNFCLPYSNVENHLVNGPDFSVYNLYMQLDNIHIKNPLKL